MNRSRAISVVLVCLSTGFLPVGSRAEELPQSLRQLHIQGGIVVHLGCGDAAATESLQLTDQILVHGLDTDASKIAAARVRLRSAGQHSAGQHSAGQHSAGQHSAGQHSAGPYGAVSVDTFDGRSLPYIDNFANVVVADELGGVTWNEVMRVLVPGGVAIVAGEKRTKPRPSEIDEWTHYMHDPQGSCVALDSVVGPPRRMQWTGGPRHGRSHEHTASVQALVSAGGRTFDVTDLGSRASIQLPSKYTLTARDAFNGTILWQREIPYWFNHLYPLKSGPAYMPRRLVAVGTAVYVSGGVGHPLLALDAATGKLLHEYSATATTVEFLVSEGVIFAVVDPKRKLFDYNQQNDNCWTERDRASNRWAWRGEPYQLKAIDAATGEPLWQRTAPIAPMTLVAGKRQVCFFDGQSVIALERDTGNDLWTSQPIVKRPDRRGGQTRRKKQSVTSAVTSVDMIRTGYGPKLILVEPYVLYSPFGRMVALDSTTGKTVWDVAKAERSGHFSPEDLFVINDTVWAAGTARGRGSTFGGYDLATGEKTKSIPNPVQAFYMHQRCYPGRATTQWLLPAATGTEFVDPRTGQWEIHHWVRGGCIYGMMPANGLLYATPQACACYYQSKLNGFTALAATPRKLPTAPANRFQRGPAEIPNSDTAARSTSEAWPTFRGDNQRSGFVHTQLGNELKQAWQVEFPGRISQATVAHETAFVCAIDQHTVHALDVNSGTTKWTFTAGGRIDSPPTIYRGLAVFGCADGHVYAVSASDGQLVWRYRAAPIDQRLASYGQVESVWPLHGSTLIEGDVLFCVAGRSAFLDGGLRMLRLDPVTGKLLGESIMDDMVPNTDQNLQSAMVGKHMPVALPDVLSSDGTFVYMKSQTFDMEGERVRIAPQSPDTQRGAEAHLFAPISFLDDSWFHRAYWVFGRAAGEGWAEWQIPGKYAPYGRILCFNDDRIFGFGRDPQYLCNSSLLEYRLYCAAKQAKEGKAVKASVTWKKLDMEPEEKLTRLAFHWKITHPPLLVRAMLLANDILLVAGPPDLVDEKAMWGRSNEPLFRQKMSEQAEALQGSRGATLWAVSAASGEKLAEYPLEDLPAFDGLSAADGRLFMATANHKLICFE